MYECFHCGERAVTWQSDFNFEDFGLFDEDGIVHVCKCSNCGADIYYYVSVNNTEGAEQNVEPDDLESIGEDSGD